VRSLAAAARRGYCCEGCILAERKQRELVVAVDEAQFALAEALAAALDAREHEMWARLFAVIDTLDAITSDRPYRRGAGFDAARAEMLSVSGTQLDPLALEAFVAEEATLREMVDLKCGAVGDWPAVAAPAASATPLGAHGSNR
jgi:hypothetical protein